MTTSPISQDVAGWVGAPRKPSGWRALPNPRDLHFLLLPLVVDGADGDVVDDLVVVVLDDTEGEGDLTVPVLGDTGDGTLYGRL